MSTENTPHLLRHTSDNERGGPDHHYFVAFGQRVTTNHPRIGASSLTLIDETCEARSRATVFESEAAALAAWDLAGRPEGWSVVPV